MSKEKENQNLPEGLIEQLEKVGNDRETDIKDIGLLPDYHFTSLQQMAYDALVSGKQVRIKWGVMSGKTYVFNAVRKDLAIIWELLNECFPGEEKPESDNWQEQATKAFENGNCPICFCTYDSHSDGCYIKELLFDIEVKKTSIKHYSNLLASVNDDVDGFKLQIKSKDLTIESLRESEKHYLGLALGKVNKPKPVKAEFVNRADNYGMCSAIKDFINIHEDIRIIDIKLSHSVSQYNAIILYEELSTDATDGKDS